MNEASFQPADRIAAIDVSEILQIGARAKAMREAGHPVITLGAGEPDFDTPVHVKAAAKAAIDRGETKYTPLAGTNALLEAIQRKFSRENSLEYDKAELFSAAGAKQILFNAFMASLNPGDEVLVPAPFWTSYLDIIAICGGIAKVLPCGANLKLAPDVLEQAIGPRTRWLMLNSPSNPSGAAYTAKDYLGLMAVVRRHPKLWVLSDDIYEHIVYDDFAFTTPAAIAADLKERILTVNGVSKAHAMTGWRLGYCGGPKDLIKAMSVVQSQATSAPSSISQAAAIAALDGDTAHLERQRSAFLARRDFVVEALNSLGGISCTAPKGAFYAFPNCQKMLGSRFKTDSALCRFLLEEAHVALVPGSAFGVPGHMRLSYAASMDDLQTAFSRISAALT